MIVKCVCFSSFQVVFLYLSSNYRCLSTIVHHWCHIGKFGWLSSLCIHIVHSLVLVGSRRLGRVTPRHRRAILLTRSIWSIIRRVLIGSAKTCQATWVQRWLIEVLGRFIGPIDVWWWWSAKSNIAQFLKALPNRTYLLFICFHFEV